MLVHWNLVGASPNSTPLAILFALQDMNAFTGRKKGSSGCREWNYGKATRREAFLDLFMSEAKSSAPPDM